MVWFRVKGTVYRVEGLGFGCRIVSGAGFRVQVPGFSVQSSGFRVQG